VVDRIRLIALDIDGVLTDGTALFAADGTEVKRICFRDLDAVTQARKMGLKVVFVTGESGMLVETLARRFGVDEVVTNAKDKVAALQALASSHKVSLSEICYVGDSDRDVPAVGMVGLGMVPADATPNAKRSAHHILNASGGQGVVREVVAFLEDRVRSHSKIVPDLMLGDSMGIVALSEQIRNIVDDSIKAKQRLLETSIEVLVKIALILSKTIQSGNKILLFGNGGSAADAQHVAAELVGRFGRDRPPWKAIALTTDTSILTAVSNDWSFEQVFARQIRALAQPNDLVVGISTSGSSKNVLVGLEEARKIGAITVGFTGEDSSPIRQLVDICFFAPASQTPRIQELHLTAWHAICEASENILPEE
jgi:D-sedoheptulose 7-phosphate isomerase